VARGGKFYFWASFVMDKVSNRHYQSEIVKQINLSFDGKPTADLSQRSLFDEAKKITGLSDFGRAGFIQSIDAFLGSLEDEADLNPFGREYARAGSLQSLANRLWTSECFRRHPEIAQRKIKAPIVIVGHHRSGTTRLHRMLATDPSLRHLKTWESLNPAPRLDKPDMGKEERRREIDEGLQALDALYPGFGNAHPMGADFAEEEMLLQRHSFGSAALFFAYNNPRYYDWFKSFDKAENYADMADHLRLLSWSTDDAEDKRWVLKNPTHMMDLDYLMATFPDAKLVFIHRDPVKTAGSLMSMRWLFAVQLTDQPLRAALRDMSLDLCETMARRCMEMRDRLVPKAQFIDVGYDEMGRDWRAVMRRIYAFADLDFTAEAEAGMAAWLADSEAENRHGGHHYRLEDFGTSAGEIDERMKFYRDWMAIPSEPERRAAVV
jgi:hypothetical protein